MLWFLIIVWYVSVMRLVLFSSLVWVLKMFVLVLFRWVVVLCVRVFSLVCVLVSVWFSMLLLVVSVIG